jgi:hypothetical protein
MGHKVSEPGICFLAKMAKQERGDWGWSWSINEIWTAPRAWSSPQGPDPAHPSNSPSCDEMGQQTIHLGFRGQANVHVWCLRLFHILKFLPCPLVTLSVVASCSSQRQAWFGVQRQTPASREDQCSAWQWHAYEKWTTIAVLPAHEWGAAYPPPQRGRWLKYIAVYRSPVCHSY